LAKFDRRRFQTTRPPTQPGEIDIWRQKGNAMVAQVLCFVNRLGGVQQRVQIDAGNALPPNPPARVTRPYTQETRAFGYGRMPALLLVEASQPLSRIPIRPSPDRDDH
jgi:hypothetical protein